MKLQDRVAEALRSKFSHENKHKLNVLAASEALGVSRPTINHWTRKNPESIAFRHLVDIEIQTGYRAEWIAFGRGNKFIDLSLTNEKLTTVECVSMSELRSFLCENKRENIKRINVIEDISGNAFAVLVDNDEFLPYIGKRDRAIINLDADITERTCLALLNSKYCFLKHKLYDKEYIKPVTGESILIPIDDVHECQIIGVVDRIIPPSRPG